MIQTAVCQLITGKANEFCVLHQLQNFIYFHNIKTVYMSHEQVQYNPVTSGWLTFGRQLLNICQVQLRMTVKRELFPYQSY